MAGRRVCGNCGASYHMVHIPPKQEGICDKCGGPVLAREDDKPEVVRTRLAVYHEETAPLEAFYKARGILRTVEDLETATPEETTARIFKALES